MTGISNHGPIHFPAVAAIGICLRLGEHSGRCYSMWRTRKFKKGKGAIWAPLRPALVNRRAKAIGFPPASHGPRCFLPMEPRRDREPRTDLDLAPPPLSPQVLERIAKWTVDGGCRGGLPVYGSLVLGGQGETYETLRNTVDFAKWLIDEKMMAALEAQPLYSDFGALTGKWMTNPVAAHEAAARQNFDILDDQLLWEMPLKYLNTDEIDFDEISKDWNKIFCNVDWGDLILATAEITSYARRHNAAAGSARISTAQLNESTGLQ